MSRPQPRKKATKSADLKRGLAIRKTLNGRRFGTTNVVLPKLAPEMEDMVNEVLFGRIWSRNTLDMKTRCLAVIASMATARLPQLRVYIANGLNAGLTKAEIVEVLVQLIFYVGLPTVSSALVVANEVFEEEGV
jgi:4-carboxymuconolactone decarboxylase